MEGSNRVNLVRSGITSLPATLSTDVLIFVINQNKCKLKKFVTNLYNKLPLF